MGRPLPEKRLEKMDLPVETFDGESKNLGKQVGYNKYVVDDENHEIITLVEEIKKPGDALLTLTDNGKDKPVIKVVDNLFQTSDNIYAYVLDEDGKPVFLKDGVDIKRASANNSTPPDETTDEPTNEIETPAEPETTVEPETPSTTETTVEPETPATTGE